jgi:hypothetical protein
VTELASPALRIGLADFHDPTLLLLGDPRSCIRLAAELEARRPVVLASQPGEELVELRRLPSENEGDCGRSGPILTWRMSSRETVTVAAQPRPMARHPRPGHAYLDHEVTTIDLQIVASQGEYEAERLFSTPPAARPS